MSKVRVRYIVNDVAAAIEFYCQELGFQEVMHPAPSFAMLSRGDLRLVLSATNAAVGDGEPTAHGTVHRPPGWNRFAIEVDDLAATVDRLRKAGARFQSDTVPAVGGKQILLEDPSGNPVELFQPDAPKPATAPHETFALRAIGLIRSTLRAVDEAPRQGAEGAPDAWLELDPLFARGLLGMAEGDEVIVVTWLHRADREVLEVHPRGDPQNPLAGVFTTRSPHRPNPLGLHRVTVREISGTRLRIGPIEAIDGTPVVDVKVVLVDADEA